MGSRAEPEGRLVREAVSCGSKSCGDGACDAMVSEDGCGWG